MFEPATPAPGGFRHCTNCQIFRDSNGGYWKIYENRKRRRWICHQCHAKQMERMALKNQASIVSA